MSERQRRDQQVIDEFRTAAGVGGGRPHHPALHHNSRARPAARVEVSTGT
ncbi:hypothetical protein ACWDZ8_39210 [Streptomyces sp. NPDC003233]